MSHSKGIYDTDLHFVIDPVTRTIRNESGKVTIIQYDHNSERFTFEIPRYIDGHDMSECNRVEVHYNNIATGQTNRGLYEVTDLQVSPEDSRYVICSWLISQNATRLVGRLAFVVRFACVTLDEEEGGEDDYAWNTSPYGDIKIVSGIYNTEEVVYEYADVLMQWKQDLIDAGIIETIEQTKTSTDDNGVNELTVRMTDGKKYLFEVRNGSRGSIGPQGYSAYEIAAQHGFEGSEAEWNAAVNEARVAAETAAANAKESETNSAVSETNAKASEQAAYNSSVNSANSATASANSASASAASETNAKASELAAKESETKAKSSEDNAKQSELNAATSASNALVSENAAKESEGKAKQSELNAKSSEDKAKQFELNAATSAANALTSEINAKTSEEASKESETNAATSAANALTSETNAKSSEDKAKQSETNAALSEANAAVSAANASTSETNARASEQAAKQSELNAKSSEDLAKQSETNAATSATNAKASEQSAKQSELNAKSSEDNAKLSETNSAASALAASTSETNAVKSEQNTKRSEQAAATSAENSANSATNAATSETNAANSELNANTSAANAAESASSAETSATAAANSARDAQANADNLNVDLVHARVDLKADNLYFDPATKLLYLTSDGEIIGDGVAITVSDAVPPEYTMTLMNLMDNNILSVSGDAQVVLEFSYSSVNSEGGNDGPGSGVVVINNVEQITLFIAQGANTFDVTNYLIRGVNTVKIEVTNSEGTIRSITYVINTHVGTVSDWVTEEDIEAMFAGTYI